MPGRAYFFFQAEDGIRARHVTGVRRVLFRSSPEEVHVADGVRGSLPSCDDAGEPCRSEERRVGTGLEIVAVPVVEEQLTRIAIQSLGMRYRAMRATSTTIVNRREDATVENVS